MYELVSIYQVGIYNVFGHSTLVPHMGQQSSSPEYNTKRLLNFQCIDVCLVINECSINMSDARSR